VHALLRHLEAVGFAGAPRVVGSGFDAEGRETLSYVEGEFVHPGPWTLDGAASVGVLLRQLHTATASFRAPPVGPSRRGSSSSPAYLAPARAPWQNTLPGDSASPSLACPWAPAPRPRSPTHTPSQFARKAGPHWGSAEGAARLSPAGCARSVVSDSHYPGAPAASLAATSASVDAADHAASAFMGGSSLGRASGTCQGEVLGAWSGRGFHEQNDHTTESKTCGGDCHGQERGPSREPAPEQRVLLHSSSGTYLTSGHDSGRLDS
jgi:hypothetical protein